LTKHRAGKDFGGIDLARKLPKIQPPYLHRSIFYRFFGSFVAQDLGMLRKF
jgi:hypothetical protein